MARKKKTEEEQINDALTHLVLSSMSAKDRQAVLGELSADQRQEVLESELDGRQARWNRTHDTEWGQS